MDVVNAYSQLVRKQEGDQLVGWLAGGLEQLVSEGRKVWALASAFWFL